MADQRLPVSLEFFPPKTPEGAEKLRAVRQKLYALRPEFCSVTFGAGGSTQAGTFATVSEILAEGVNRSGGDANDPAHRPDQGGLARPVGTEQREDFAAADL